MQSSLQRQLEEMQRYAYLHGSKPKASQLTGLPKTRSVMSGVFEAACRAATIAEINRIYEQEYYRMGIQNPEEQRYRSFVERYVIERSPLHKDPLKDGWAAILDAKALYKMIENSAGEYRPSPETPQAGQAGQLGKAVAGPTQPGLSGATGPIGPPYGLTADSIHSAYLQGIERGDQIARRDAAEARARLAGPSLLQRVCNALQPKDLSNE
jgi:hypothetical protein